VHLSGFYYKNSKTSVPLVEPEGLLPTTKSCHCTHPEPDGSSPMLLHTVPWISVFRISYVHHSPNL